MTSTVGSLLARLGTEAPWEKAAGWDVSGLQLGDGAAEVRSVGVCHEVTEAVVAAVEREPLDLLVTYHPLLLHPTNRLVAGRTPEGRAWRLARTGVALAVMHTAFDTTRGGTADALASALGLGDVRGVGPVVPAGQVKIVTFVPPEAVEDVAAAMAAVGAGRVGNYSGCSFRTQGVGAFFPEPGAAPAAGEVGEASRVSEVRLEMVAAASRTDAALAALATAHPYEEPAFDVFEVRANHGFVGRVGELPATLTLAELSGAVAEALGSEGLRVSGDRQRNVKKVAVVPGAGGSLIEAVGAAGADVLVTGDVSHHRVVAALDRGLAVVDAGHVPTERPGMGALASRVAAAAGEARLVDLTCFDPTPWRT